MWNVNINTWYLCVFQSWFVKGIESWDWEEATVQRNVKVTILSTDGAMYGHLNTDTFFYSVQWLSNLKNKQRMSKHVCMARFSMLTRNHFHRRMTSSSVSRSSCIVQFLYILNMWRFYDTVIDMYLLVYIVNVYVYMCMRLSVYVWIVLLCLRSSWNIDLVKWVASWNRV